MSGVASGFHILSDLGLLNAYIKLKSDIEGLQTNIGSLLELVNDTTSVSNSNEYLGHLTAYCIKLTQKLNEISAAAVSQSKIDEVDAAIHSLMDEVRSQDNDIRANRETQGTIDRRIESISDELSSVVSRVDRLKSVINSSSSKLNSISEHNSRLSAIENKLANEIASSLSSIISSVNNLKSRIDSSSGKISLITEHNSRLNEIESKLANGNASSLSVDDLERSIESIIGGRIDSVLARDIDRASRYISKTEMQSIARELRVSTSSLEERLDSLSEAVNSLSHSNGAARTRVWVNGEINRSLNITKMFRVTQAPEGVRVKAEFYAGGRLADVTFASPSPNPDASLGHLSFNIGPNNFDGSYNLISEFSEGARSVVRYRYSFKEDERTKTARIGAKEQARDRLRDTLRSAHSIVMLKEANGRGHSFTYVDAFIHPDGDVIAPGSEYINANYSSLSGAVSSVSGTAIATELVTPSGAVYVNIDKERVQRVLIRLSDYVAINILPAIENIDGGCKIMYSMTADPSLRSQWKSGIHMIIVSKDSAILRACQVINEI